MQNDMKTRKIFLLLLAAAITLPGCKSTRTLLPSVSGKAGEIIVVMEKSDWEDSLGGEVRELLASDCPWLAQKEPLYTLVNVIPSVFGDLFRVHRNILLFQVGPQIDTTGIIFKHDVWASPQIVIQLSAPTAAQASEFLEEKGPMIISSIEQAERDRVIRNTLRYEESTLYPQIAAIFGGSPHFPSGYRLRKATDHFAWIADDKQVYQDVFVYRYPVEDDPFTQEKIIAHRNAMLQENVPGMFDGTYMTTSEYFAPTSNISNTAAATSRRFEACGRCRTTSWAVPSSHTPSTARTGRRSLWRKPGFMPLSLTNASTSARSSPSSTPGSGSRRPKRKKMRQINLSSPKSFLSLQSQFGE